MTELFLHVVNLSISASWLILAVLLARVVMKHAPRWAHVLLWGLVGIRLVCPISLESIWSLIPSAQTISPTLLTDSTPTVQTGFPTLNQTINPVLSQAAAATPDATPNLLEIWLPTLAAVWVLGVAVGLGYAAVGYLRLRRQLSSAVELEDRIFQSSAAHVPFVLGLIHPNIYLPHSMDRDTLAHVIAHEQAHLKRRDHWWKALGFLLLCIHWFNPLVWVAYGAFCRDVELACDEAVVKHLDHQARADYSQALLLCSVGRASWKAGPLCFGEVGVKQRVKAVLHYRRPALTTVAASVLLCALVGVMFLTNPPTSREFPMQGHNVADLDPQYIVDRIVHVENLDESTSLFTTSGATLTLNFEFEFAQSEAAQFYYFHNQQYFCSQLRWFLETDNFYVVEPTVHPQSDQIYLFASYLEALKYLPQEEIRQLSPQADQYQIIMASSGESTDQNRTITYTADGVGNINSWLIHLTVLPLYKNEAGGYHSSDGFIHLLYGAQSAQILATYWGTGYPGQFLLQSSDTTYSYNAPCLQLLADGTFIWSPSLVMSSVSHGYYEQTEDSLTLSSNNGAFLYVFDKEGDTLTYNADASSQPLPIAEWPY